MKNLKKNKSLIAKFAIVLTTIIWGTSFVVMKESVSNFPVSYLLFIRFGIAAITLAGIFWKRLKKLNKDYLIGGGLMGLFLFLAYEAQTYGLKATTPGKNAFLTVTYCVIVPFLYVIFFRKKLTVFNFLAAFLCLFGMGLISLDAKLSIGIGDILSIVCGIIFAIHILVIEKFSKDKDSILLSLIQFATVSVLSLITALFTETPPQNISASTIFPLVYLALFATCFGFLCQTFGQKHTPPTTASILLSLEAVFGVLISIILGYDEFSTRLFLGFLFVFLAVIISETDFTKITKRLLKEGH